jgi:hypothetical protein
VIDTPDIRLRVGYKMEEESSENIIFSIRIQFNPPLS